MLLRLGIEEGSSPGMWSHLWTEGLMENTQMIFWPAAIQWALLETVEQARNIPQWYDLLPVHQNDLPRYILWKPQEMIIISVVPGRASGRLFTEFLCVNHWKCKNAKAWILACSWSPCLQKYLERVSLPYWKYLLCTVSCYQEIIFPALVELYHWIPPSPAQQC